MTYDKKDVRQDTGSQIQLSRALEALLGAWMTAAPELHAAGPYMRGCVGLRLDWEIRSCVVALLCADVVACVRVFDGRVCLCVVVIPIGCVDARIAVSCCVVLRVHIEIADLLDLFDHPV